MRHFGENLARTLKEARKDKAMSQRELSIRSGVPQPHISRIENNDVDLRHSSIASLAYALDLELMLVPRRAVPAVRSIARGDAFRSSRGNADALRELNRARNAVVALPGAVGGASAAGELDRRLSELGSLRNLFHGTDAVRDIRSAIEAIDIADRPERLWALADDVKALSEGLAQSDSEVGREPGGSRPAYRPDEEDGDG